MIPEICFPIPNYEGLYEISIFGNIFSLKPPSRRLPFNKRNKLIPSSNGNGYLRVYLCNKTKPKKFYVHRLMADTFLPLDENRKDINHKNGIRTDNHIQNIERATRKENMANANRRGIMPKGQVHKSSKLSNDEVYFIKHLNFNGWRIKDLAKIYSVSQSQIGRILSGKSRKHD